MIFFWIMFVSNKKEMLKTYSLNTKQAETIAKSLDFYSEELRYQLDMLEIESEENESSDNKDEITDLVNHLQHIEKLSQLFRDE